MARPRKQSRVIVVSAENPDAPAELRQRAPLRYIPSALLNANLRRHVYLSYGTELLLEQTLQLDAAGDPQYIVTLGRPTIGWTGEIVTAVVIVNPATGAMQRIARADFAQLPAWVSRCIRPTSCSRTTTGTGATSTAGGTRSSRSATSTHPPGATSTDCCSTRIASCGSSITRRPMRPTIR